MPAIDGEDAYRGTVPGSVVRTTLQTDIVVFVDCQDGRVVRTMRENRVGELQPMKVYM